MVRELLWVRHVRITDEGHTKVVAFTETKTRRTNNEIGPFLLVYLSTVQTSSI